MTKYVLAKDLPYVKAGTSVDIIERDVQMGELKIKFLKIEHVDDFGEVTFTLIPNNKIDEWIEEIKPREFFINVNKSEAPHAYYAYEFEPNKIKDLSGYIKVREIIE